MKRLTAQMRLVSLLGLLVFLWSTAYAQITPLGDAYTNTADSTTNYGAKTLLDVDGATQITYLQFNLASIPATASISQATLKLYVNSVTSAGSFNVDYVNGSWSESTIDASNAPPFGTTIASQVALTTVDKNQYILINITPAVQAWLSGSETNNGIALVANGSFNATFDSKENTTTSHPAELDIAFAGGDGTVTGVTTAAGSGLTGGGTSGTLDLSLTNACGANQVLRWNGSAWACSTAGTGTVTGVKAGTDLTGGGTSGNVTLNLNTANVPLLAAANTFTGNQTVNGNLSATGVVTGNSFNLGSNLFAFGSYGKGNAFLGFAGNAAATGSYNTASGALALQSITTGIENTASGYGALQLNTAASGNTALGYAALTSNSGSFNTANGVEALYSNTNGYQNTAIGVATLLSNTTGYYNTAIGNNALRSNTSGNSNTASGYGALNSNTTASPNDAFGFEALGANTQGTYNVGLGYQSLHSNVGDSSGDGSYNTAVGSQALYTNNDTSGSGFSANYEVAVGYQALYSNTTGQGNTATGAYALYFNATGYGNTATGSDALIENTTGSENTAVGNDTLAGNMTGDSLTCVGFGCSATSDGISNATAIGAHARVGASNSLVLGGTGKYAVKVGIGTETPSNILTIAQGTGHPVSDGWETFSSRRWKTNIQTLHGSLGKVEQLRGVSYDLKANGKHEVGVIAEEVGAVVPEVVTWEKDGKDAQSVDYSRLTALLIEATKEQQRELAKALRQIRQQQDLLRKQAIAMESLKAEVREDRETLHKVKARTPAFTFWTSFP
jgi:trimeric autotransporter adhesin